jgi:hypothetical protein
MAVIRCPACGKPNPDFLEKCQYCEAQLKPGAGASAEDTLIRAPAGTVRCQACGRANAADREFCQYCEARLRPLVAGEPAPPATPASAEAAQDPLARLRSTQTFDALPAEPEAGEPAAEPDPASWMNRLRSVGAPASSEDTIVPGSRVAEPEPDWMFNEAAQAPVEESPAWLRDEPPPPADTPVPPVEAPHSADDDELPDWLANLRSTAASPAPAPTPPPEPQTAARARRS